MENEICHLKLEDIIPKNTRPYNESNNYIEQDLIESIRKHGIIQPIIVKKENEQYEIIDGNRRYYAAKKCGLNKIPVLIKNLSGDVTRINLSDNLYNQDLSPIEEAKKYKEILETTSITQEELANNIGKSQSSLANKLRLLNLSIEIQDALNNYEISERHARSLLTVKNKEQQLSLLEKIKKEKITVRELDSEIKNMSNMFIPEEFSNKNNNNSSNNFNQNYNENNMFMSNESVNNNFNENDYLNTNNNVFISQDNNNNQNSFIPNNNYNNMDNTNFNNQFDLPNNNGGMNPFLTSNNYIPPMPDNNTQNNNGVNNPFSSIRMNSSNITNENNNENSNLFFTSNNNSNMNEDNDEFNIDDYKLPEYDNNDYDQAPYSNIETPTPFETNGVPTNDYKYVEENPNYVSVDNPVGVSSVDDVINVLKAALAKIKNGKIKVDTEEIDYDDNYQITIRIDKKGDFL